MLFRSRLLDLGFGPGTESLEVRLFDEAEIPWREIAFPVVKETLKLYFADRGTGHFPPRFGDIVRAADDPRRYRIRVHGGGPAGWIPVPGS